MNALPYLLLTIGLGGQPVAVVPQALFSREAVYWEDQDFVDNAFTFDNNVEAFAENYSGWFEEHKEAVRNDYCPGVIDTLYSFTQTADTVMFFKGGGEEFLTQAILRTPVVSLKDGIRVGMTKAEFKEILGKKCPIPDFLQIGDHAKNQIYYFYFENDRLHTIYFDGYLD